MDSTKIRVLLGDALINVPMCMTFIYGNMFPYMYSYFHFRLNSSSTSRRDLDPAWILPLLLVFQSLGVLAADPVRRRVGLVRATLCAIILNVAHLVLVRVTIEHSVWLTCLDLALLGGFTSGLLMAVNVAHVSEWFPGQHNGKAMAAVLSAAGLGSILQNFVTTAYINPENLSADVTRGGLTFFSQDQIVDRVPMVWVVLGGIAAMFQVIGFCLISIRTSGKLSCASDNDNLVKDFPKTCKASKTKTFNGGEMGEGRQKDCVRSGDGRTYSTFNCSQNDHRGKCENEMENSSAFPSPPPVYSPNTSMTSPPPPNYSSSSSSPPQNYSSSSSSPPPYTSASSLHPSKSNSEGEEDEEKVASSYSHSHQWGDSGFVPSSFSLSVDGEKDDISSSSSSFSMDGQKDIPSSSSLEEDHDGKKSNSDDKNKTLREIVTSPSFFVVWFSNASLTLAHVVAFNYYKVFGETWIDDDQFLTLTGSLSSIFISAILLGLGPVVDRIGVKDSLVACLSLTSVLLLLWCFTARLHRWLFLLWTAVLMGLVSSHVLLMPIAALKLYGNTCYITVFGLLQTAAVLGDLLFPFLFTHLIDGIGWFGIFSMTGAVTFVADLLVLCVLVVDKD